MGALLLRVWTKACLVHREAFQHSKRYSTAPAWGDKELHQSLKDKESSAEGYQKQLNIVEIWLPTGGEGLILEVSQQTPLCRDGSTAEGCMLWEHQGQLGTTTAGTVHTLRLGQSSTAI